MNHIKLTPLYRKVINGNHLQEQPVTIKLDGTIYITPYLLYENNKMINIEELYGFNANISCDKKVTIVIKGFDYFSLMTYSDTDAVLSYLKVYDIIDFFRLNNIQMNRLDIENSNALCCDCKINNVNVGIETHRENNEVQKNKKRTHPDIELRNCIIDSMSVYTHSEKINTKESIINKLELKGSINFLRILDYSEIRYLKVTQTLQDFYILNSKIDTIIGTSTFLLKKFTSEYSYIDKSQKIFKQNIDCERLESLELLRNSYMNENNISEYSQYSYLINNLLLKKEKRKRTKLGMYIMKKTCGFGYNISKAIRFCTSTILLFSILYFLIQLIGGNKYGFEIVKDKSLLSKYLCSLYHSMVTFATLGYGDTTIMDWFTRFISGFESLIGIFSMSIIIYTVTNKIIKR